MRKVIVLVLVLAFSLPLSTVYSQDVTSRINGNGSCLEKANHLLDEALGFMQKHYYRKRYIQWDTLIANAKSQLAASGNCEDTYDIISNCFRQINETHSFLMPPSKAAIYNNDTGALQQKPVIAQLVGDIRGELITDRINTCYRSLGEYYRFIAMQ